MSSSILPEGFAGPVTWDALGDIVRAGRAKNDANPLELLEQALREQIIRIASSEVGLVAAKMGGSWDLSVEPSRQFRRGYERLLVYFRTAAPQPANPLQSVFSEVAIKYLAKRGEIAPMAHWCGIFALWATKTAGCQVGTWIPRYGIASVSGFRVTHAPKMGDIGFLASPKQHHFLVVRAFEESGKSFLETVEGNSGTESEVTHVPRRLYTKELAFYTCFGSART